jgi:uncharacterized membrane protein
VSGTPASAGPADPVSHPLARPLAEMVTARWVGPLPPPDLLQAYGGIDPSFPERIFRMAETDARHCLDLEVEAMRDQRETLRSIDRFKARGQGCAAGLAVVFAIVGAWMGYLGHPGAGATIITGTVVGLATVFVLGRSGRD